MAPFSPFGGGGVSMSQVDAAIAAAIAAALAAYVPPTTQFWIGQIAQSGTDAPVIYDSYTNMTGVTFTPARTVQGDYTLLPSSDVIDNSIRTYLTWNQYFADAAGFVQVDVLAGLPRTKVRLRSFNLAGAAADSVLIGILYIEILDNTI